MQICWSRQKLATGPSLIPPRKLSKQPRRGSLGERPRSRRRSSLGAGPDNVPSLGGDPAQLDRGFLRSKGERVDAVVGPDVEPVTGRQQRLEMSQPGHFFTGPAAGKQRLA